MSHSHNTRHASTQQLQSATAGDIDNEPIASAATNNDGIANESKPPLSPKPKQFPSKKLFDMIEKLEAKVIALTNDSKEKQETIHKLENRVQQLEAKQVRIESYNIVKDNTSKLLQNRITQLEQYTRRPSVIVKGIPLSENRGSREEEHQKLKNEVQKVLEMCKDDTTSSSLAEVDKFHRNGPSVGNEQDVIIRFKTHTAKEFFYNNRKSIPDGRIKVQPSLSQATRTLLDEAKIELETRYADADHLVNPPEFVFANLHGQLLVKMKNRMKFGNFLRFDSIDELHNKIGEQNDVPHRDCMDAFNAEMERFIDRD